MRILHLTDTHLGMARHLLGSPPGWSRADDHFKSMSLALQPALREEVDLVIHSGDVFDRSSPPRRDVERAGVLLREVARRVPVLVMAGNHDRHGIRRWFPHRDLRVFDVVRRVEIGGLSIGMVPHARTAEAWSRRVERLAGVDVLVAHQSFHGVRVPGLTFTVGAQRDTVGVQHLPKGVGHVMCGHIHPRQVLQVGEATVVHPGSTERTSWSEKDETKGYALWSFGSEPRWRFVDLPSRPMRVVRGWADLEAVQPGDMVKLRGDVPVEEVVRRGGYCRPPNATQRVRPSRPSRPLFAGSSRGELFEHPA